MAAPTIRLLSLGAGVQSTALLIMSAAGRLPKLDGAIFSDTGWEPPEVYAHLERLEAEVARPAGIPIYRVGTGNIRNDALNPDTRFASMPLFIKNPDNTQGIAHRQCTGEYKLKPIKEQVRRMLGAPTRPDGKPGSVPRGRAAEQWIGYSTDERDRALDKNGDYKTSGVSYSISRYPLLEAGMTRDDCTALNKHYGFGDTPKSACIGCPFHTNRQWRKIRENPASWQDAVDFDNAIRNGSARANANGQPLRGEAYLHRSMLPLAEAPIDRINAREWAQAQGDLVADLAALEFEESLEDDNGLGGCSPYSCHDEPVDDDEDAQES